MVTWWVVVGPEMATWRVATESKMVIWGPLIWEFRIRVLIVLIWRDS